MSEFIGLFSSGIIVITLGILILRFKSAVHLITIYKEGKYDDDKLRKLVGWRVTAVGFMCIASAFYMLTASVPISIWLVAVNVGVIVAIVIDTIYRSEKYCRKK